MDLCTESLQPKSSRKVPHIYSKINDDIYCNDVFTCLVCDLYLLDRKTRKLSRSNNEITEKSTKRKTHDRNVRKCSNVINVSMVNREPLQMKAGPTPTHPGKCHCISIIENRVFLNK